MLTWTLAACAGPLAGPLVLENARLPGGEVVAVEIRDGRLAKVGEVGPSELPRVDARGATLVPAFVDSHVHLAYFPVGRELSDGGVAAAVDLAAPLRSIGPIEGGPRMVWAGPMITAVGGYPTRSWGAGGYGLEVPSPERAAAAVDELHKAGARVIKVPVEAGGLPDEALARVVQAAHAKKLLVVAHALDEASAARAARAGIDGLAHTPVEPLSPATIALWAQGDRFVISTLRAFGSLAAPGNLKALREAGVEVLYGTDLGNTREVGIDPVEVELMVKAGMDGAAILQAATRAPAAKWGFSELGEIAVGKAASFLLLDADPLVEPRALAQPREIWIDGMRR